MASPTVVSVEWIDLDSSSADPTPIALTIPGTADTAIVFWELYCNPPTTLVSATLDGASYDQQVAYTGGVSGYPSAGAIVFFNPTSGDLDISWGSGSDNSSEGPICAVVYIKDGDLTAVRDLDADTHDSGSATVTIDSNTTDLVLAFDAQYGSAPGIQTGWTISGSSNTDSGHGAVVSTKDSPGASTSTADSQGSSFDAIVAVSIPEGSTAIIPQVMHHRRMMQ